MNFEEGAERSLLDGSGREVSAEVASSVPSHLRDLNLESAFEYGSRVGVWRLLDILNDHSLAATFFMCGLACERNLEVARAITSLGHEPCGHGYRWESHHAMSEQEQMEDVQRCVDALVATIGQRPVGWLSRYAPAPTTRLVLAKVGGFLYDSNAFNDDVPYFDRVGNTPFLVVPYSLELNDARCWRDAMLSVHEFEEFLMQALERLDLESRSTTRLMSIGLHCRISGTPGRAGVLDRFLRAAKRRGAWIARRDDIARHWIQECPPIDPVGH